MKKLFKTCVINKMIKTVLFPFALAFAFIISSLDTPAASGTYVVDDGDMISSSDESSINAKVSKICSETGVDVVIMTSDDEGAGSAQQFADDFYDNGGYGENGVLFYVNSSTRDVAISTSGFGVTAFTDAGCDYILDKLSPSLSEGDYGKACSSFADMASDFIKAAKNGKPYDKGHLPKGKLPAVKDLLIALIGGFGFSFLKTSSQKNATTNVVHEATKASHYLTENSLNLTASEDVFTSSEIKRNTSSSSGGGSTTHTSSSGRTHGGSSRKF